jgi:flagellar basal-body rod protein FlgB
MSLMHLGGLTATAIGYALDGLSMRHEAIATNIANANSQGYRPREVNFESYLADFIQSENPSAAALPPISIQPASSALMLQNSVEMQTVALNQNVLQYQALITGLDKYMSTISTAVNEGKK